MRDYIPIRNVARTICGIQNQTLYHHCLDGSIEWSGEGNYHSPKCAVQIDSFLKWLKENFAYRDSMDFLSVEAYLKAYREGNTDADYYGGIREWRCVVISRRLSLMLVSRKIVQMM